MKFWRQVLDDVVFGAHCIRKYAVCAAIYAVRFYQITISPLLGPTCRFTPTCSQYCILALRKYGLVVGLLKTAYRILRCNPFCKGGVDWP